MPNDYLIFVGPVRSLVLFEALQRGDPQDMVRALLAWRFDLTRQEICVLEHLTRGFSDVEIAAQMRIAGINTVKKAVRSVLSKLGVRNRTQAAVLAARSGLDAISNPQPHSNE
jgi:DNA-binding NarL/FixJ family response regulator